MQNKMFVKSVYLAFAFSPNIQLDELSNKLQPIQSVRFTLTKNTEIISKSQTLPVQKLADDKDIYFYLSVPQYRLGSSQKYLIEMFVALNGREEIIFDKQIDLIHYIDDYQKDKKSFWTEISQFQAFGNRIMLRKRIFLKKSKEQLQILQKMTSQQVDRQQQTQMSQSRKMIKSKQKNQTQFASSLLFNQYEDLPIRLDTITQEESTIFSNIKRYQTNDFEDDDFKNLQVRTPGVTKNKKIYQNQWKHHQQRYDSKFFKLNQQAIEGQKNMYSSGGALKRSSKRLHSYTPIQMPKINQSQFQNIDISSHNSLGYDIQPKASKISKQTKYSQRQIGQVQDDDNVSELNRSCSFRSNLSQLSINQQENFQFKLKYFIFVVFIIAIALVASFSDMFEINVDKIKSKNKKKAKRSNIQRNNKKSNKKTVKQHTQQIQILKH